MKDNAMIMLAAEEILEDDDIEIQEGDVTRSLINGIITIEFSDFTPYPTQVMVWIRLPGLPVPLYKERLIEKYKLVDSCPLSVHHAVCTPLWRAVSAAWIDLRSSIAWSLGTGDNIHPLDDTWISSLGPLRRHLLQGADVSQVQHVSDLLDIHNHWDVLKLSGWFSPATISHILSIRCPDASDIPDKQIWGLNDKNIFDVKSTYASQVSGGWDSESTCCKTIWSLRVPQRIRFLLWLSLGVLHVLCDCNFAQEVWKLLLPPWLHDSFFACDTQIWLLLNVSKHDIHPAWDLSWHLLFTFAVWHIWKSMNEWIFHGTQSNVDKIVQRSVTWARYFSECASWVLPVYSFVVSKSHWQRSEPGWVCLNTDGVASSSTGIGSIKGIFRADDGSWILGFNKMIGVTHPLQAELWGILISHMQTLILAISFGKLQS
ncbi:hypothetical protein V6N12_044440 [Hibiscus sabdariffa]|uniref:RNase H type-1 domain-containing protein n=1 Tax=Hibiscus sabdariffa TaxID=183260 RepID=A0ABR2BPT3_9ROSI